LKGKAEPAEKRFFNFVEQIPFHTCWEWTGAIIPVGYGLFWNGKAMEYAHRYSYRLHNGEIAKGNVILHSCDNPSCVNPAHLCQGTQLENQQDCKAKGRLGNRGKERKLTDVTVEQIIKLYKLKVFKQNQLAEMFGVTQATISYIINGKLVYAATLLGRCK